MKSRRQLEKTVCDELAGPFSRTMVELSAAFAAKVGLHDTDFKLVSTLAAAGPLHPKDLGRRHHMSTAAVSLALDRLEKAGLAQRRPDPDDGRRVVVRLVDEPDFAQDLGDSMRSLAASMVEVTDGFTVAELSAVLRFLRESGAVLDRVSEALRRSVPN